MKRLVLALLIYTSEKNIQSQQILISMGETMTTFTIVNTSTATIQSIIPTNITTIITTTKIIAILSNANV